MLRISHDLNSVPAASGFALRLLLASKQQEQAVKLLEPKTGSRQPTVAAMAAMAGTLTSSWRRRCSRLHGMLR